MTNDQFKILESLANDGPQVRADVRLDWKIVEMENGGWIKTSAAFDTDRNQMTRIALTISGRAAYEAECNRRKEASLVHKAGVAVWNVLRLIGTLIVGVIIGRSEGCMFGEAGSQPRGNSDSRAGDRAKSECNEYATLGDLEQAPQFHRDQGLPSGVVPGLDDRRAKDVGDVVGRELSPSDMNGEERDESRAAVVGPVAPGPECKDEAVLRE